MINLCMSFLIQSCTVPMANQTWHETCYWMFYCYIVFSDDSSCPSNSLHLLRTKAGCCGKSICVFPPLYSTVSWISVHPFPRDHVCSDTNDHNRSVSHLYVERNQKPTKARKCLARNQTQRKNEKGFKNLPDNLCCILFDDFTPLSIHFSVPILFLLQN